MLKTLKRKIALVAVAALGAGGLSIAVAPVANAAVITGSTAAVSPVRVSFTDTALDAVPYAELKVTLGTGGGTFTAATGSTATFDLVSAPVGGKVEVSVAGTTPLTGGTTNIAGGAATTTVAGLALDTTNLVYTGDADATAAEITVFSVKANRIGTYAGTIAYDEDGAGGAGDTFTVSFAFTTTGAPTSWTVAGTATTSLVSGTDTVTATLLDAAARTTQPSSLDTLALSNTRATSFNDGADTAVTATELAKGTIDLTYTAGNTAGVDTVTVTPQGTLPGVGLTAKTLSYTVSGTVSDVAVTALSVSTPATAVAAGTIAAGNVTSQVPAGTSSLVVSFTHGTASAKVRWKVSGTAGTINGAVATTAQYFNVDADALGKGTLTLTLAGSALVETTAVTVEQVTVANGVVDGDGVGGANPAVDIVITQTARAVAVGTITLAPTGNIIAKLGTATAPTETTVKVTVADQFTTAIGAGYTVRAYRTAVNNANLLSTGVTATDGTVSITVKHATTLVAAGAETYVFQVSAPGVTPVEATATVIINYTTTGEITGMTTTVNRGTTNLAAAAGLVAATAQTTYAAIEIPADGTASDATFDAIYTVTTAGVTLTAGGAYDPATDGGELVTLRTTATPANSAEYTTSEGLFLCKTTSCAWNAGLTSATISDATDVYVFGTKTGIGTVTIKSGGLTREVKVFVKNAATNFYTLTATPATASVAGGSYGTITVSVKDIFGNAVDTGATDLAVTADGAVLLGGMAASTTTGTGAAGTATVTYIGNNTGGAGTITIDGVPTTGAWATGYTKPTGAGDPSKKATVALTVTAASAAANPEITAVKADVKAVSDTVATLSKAVTTIQSSVTELTSSFSAQIKSLSSAIAKISRAIAALSKKIK